MSLTDADSLMPSQIVSKCKCNSYTNQNICYLTQAGVKLHGDCRFLVIHYRVINSVLGENISTLSQARGTNQIGEPNYLQNFLYLNEFLHQTLTFPLLVPFKKLMENIL